MTWLLIPAVPAFAWLTLKAHRTGLSRCLMTVSNALWASSFAWAKFRKSAHICLCVTRKEWSRQFRTQMAVGERLL